MDITPFSEQLTYLNNGKVDEELTAELAKVVQSVLENGKPAHLTLTIAVQRLNQSHESAIRLTPEIKTKFPKQPKPETIMFATDDGELLRDDPVQLAMKLA